VTGYIQLYTATIAAIDAYRTMQNTIKERQPDAVDATFPDGEADKDNPTVYGVLLSGDTWHIWATRAYHAKTDQKDYFVSRKWTRPDSALPFS
jgi:hypothetical protein